MPLWSRIANLFRAERLTREIDEEIEAHMAEAVAEGRDPADARRAFGSPLRHREESRDIRLIPWLDSLRADAVFGWRQLMKHKVTSAAAVLSLALGIGASTAAFRLIDSLLLRPLPVSDPHRLYAISIERRVPDGRALTYDGCSYPLFRQMRAAVKDRADLIAVSYADRIDLTYKSDLEAERAYRQYVSGWMFSSLGVRPALGRVFTENDDVTPGAHPYAVVSYDYWTRRLGQDPKVIGRTFRTGVELYEIVGVAQKTFTGTEPGFVTDIFLPTMMVKNNGIARSDYQWFRTLVKLKPGVTAAAVGARLKAVFRGYLQETVKLFPGMPRQEFDEYLNRTMWLNPASAGVSGMQRDYGRSLAALCVLVAMVLLIACANVANLMTARGAARAREMALRVSIGAGRGRLVQLVLVECAWLAMLAGAAGGLFAAWAAPFVIGAISPPDSPIRLILPADWRVLAFGLAVALGVTLLFGLPPALRASAVKPSSTLKGGDDPHARRRLMRALIGIQVAFCFFVLFVAGLFAASFGRLSHQPLGFSADGLLAVEAMAAQPQPAALWRQTAEHLRSIRGVEDVALCEWPLMTGESWNGFISVDGAPPPDLASYFLNVSAGWRGVMKIALLAGRDFRGNEPSAVAIVNQAFARQYLGTENVVGRPFDIASNEGPRYRYQIVGLVANARYRDMREPLQPVAYFPFLRDFARANFMVRTSDRDPLSLANAMRREVPRARPEFHAGSIRTQVTLVRAQTVRERMLAMLALFFAGVAVVLAGVGLYGVLDYSVLQRRREIGIRMAIGAPAADIARRVTADIFSIVLAGALAGLALGMASVRYVETLFYHVKATDPGALALPTLTIVAAALAAGLPAVMRAVRIDPAAVLRAE